MGITFSKSQERFGVSPTCGVISTIRLQQFFRRVVITCAQEPACEQVANTLIVIRIQPQHVLQVFNSGGAFATLPKAVGKGGPGAHVGACLKQAPEAARIVFEGLRTQRLLSGRHHAFVAVALCNQCSGFVLRQQGMGVGA